eukprot:Hpha_TRINITY_DN16712_c0_g2::TRINITY_DN16712_c0_g2_i2::g.78672::m.78672
MATGAHFFGAQPTAFGNQLVGSQFAMFNQPMQLQVARSGYSGPAVMPQSFVPVQSFPSGTQTAMLPSIGQQLMVAVPVQVSGAPVQVTAAPVQVTAAPVQATAASVVQATAAPVQAVCATSMAVAVSSAASAVPFAQAVPKKPDARPAQRSPRDSRVRVIALLGVPITANVAHLERTVETVFGAQVLRSQALWNRATVLVEMDRDILIQKRVSVGLPGVCALASSKGAVAVPKESAVLNVRFFVLHPAQDFVSTPEENEVYARAEQEWAQKVRVGEFRDDLLLARKLEEASGETWVELATPLEVRRVAEVPGQRRLYTQLYLAFQDEASALEAAVASDGKIIEAMGLRMVVRSEYAKPGAIDPAPRVQNPNLQ